MSWWQESTPVGDTSNLTKFLDFLSKAEGADYNTIVGGSKFNSFDAHPGVVGLRTKEGPSTAAGRYQITKTTYDDVAPRLGIKDFSPQSQDAIAVELIRRGGAYDDVLKGNFESAINKLGSTWASLPSSPYSQPKKSWSDVNRMLGVQVASNNASNNWWAGATPVSDAPSNDNWWASATPVQTPAQEPAPKAAAPAPAAPTATTQAAPAAAPKAAPQPAPQRTTAQNFGLGTRNVLEGVEQAFTYPVRAVGEAASGIAGLLGNKELADTISRTVGMKNKGAGALAADTLGLAKPETKTEKIVSEGTKAAAGLLSGSIVNKAAEKAPEVVKGALNILMPGTSGSTTQVAKDVGVFGGLGAAVEAAPAETAAGLAALAAGKAAAGRVVGPKVGDFLDNRAANKLLDAAGPRNVRQDAEIVRRMAQEFDDPLRAVSGSARPLGTKELNGKIEQSFLREGQDLVAQLPKDFAGKKTLETALARGVKNTTDEIAALRSVQGGEQVADLIEAAKRTQAVTAAVASTGGLMPAVRYGVQKALPGFLSEPINAVIGQRQTREAVGQKLIDRFARGVDKVEQRFGAAPSRVAAQELQGIVKEADNTALANIMGAKREQVSAKRLADEAAAKAAAEKEAQKLLKQQEAQMIREGGDILKTRQATEKAAATKQAQEATAKAAADKAREKAIADNIKTAQANVQSNQQRLIQERAAEAAAKAEREQALLSAQSRNSQAAQANVQSNQQRLLQERGLGDTAAAAADAQRAKALAAAQEENRRKSLAALEQNRANILKERQAKTTAENQGALSALMQMSGGRDVGGGPLRATLDSFSRRFGLDDQAGMGLLTRMRDEATDPAAKKLLDTLLSNQKIDDLYGLQDIVAAYGKKSGVISNVPGGALSAETGRVFNQTSYDATVRTAEAARDAAIKSAPSPSLKQFAIDVANEKSPAAKIEKLNERVKATSDPEELGYLLNMVEPLTKFGKKAKK